MPYFTTSTGIKIYYESHGLSGPPVIFLHGLGSSTHIWELQFAAMQDHFCLYALDFPGHGQSDWLDHYSFTLFSDVLHEFMQFIGIERASVVALSLGCTVALTYACNYPNSVLHLVLESPVGGGAPFYSPRFWIDTFIFGMVPMLLILGIAMLGYKNTAHFIDTFGVKSDANVKLLESIHQGVDRKAIWQLLFQSAHPPYVGKLKHIQIPILVVRGQNDPAPERFCTYIQKQTSGPYAYKLIPAVRHIVALENPEEFNQAVIRFISETR